MMFTFTLLPGHDFLCEFLLSDLLPSTFRASLDAILL